MRYRAAIDRITQKRDLGLRDFELTDEEWKLAEQLRDSLKVCLLVSAIGFYHDTHAIT